MYQKQAASLPVILCISLILPLIQLYKLARHIYIDVSI